MRFFNFLNTFYSKTVMEQNVKKVKGSEYFLNALLIKCTHTHTHMRVYTHIHTNITCTRFVHTSIHIHTHPYTSIQMYAHMHAQGSVHSVCKSSWKSCNLADIKSTQQATHGPCFPFPLLTKINVTAFAVCSHVYQKCFSSFLNENEQRLKKLWGGGPEEILS